MDSFQGCYKDGTEPGEWDCRWFASIYLILRFIFFLCYGFTLSAVFFPFSGIFVLFFILLILFIRPYKASYSRHASTNIGFLVLYAMFYFGLSGIDVAGIKSIHFVSFFYDLSTLISLIPLIFTFVLVLFWFYSRRKFGLALAHRASAWRRGYSLLVEEEGVGVEVRGVEEQFGDQLINPDAYRVNPAGSVPSSKTP